MLRWTIRVLLLFTFPFWGLAFIFWKIFTKLVNSIGIQEIRNFKGALQTPVHCYKHPATQKTVLLIGMVHIAESAYFEKIYKTARFLEEGPCHKVLYEFVKVAPKEIETLNPKERKLHKQLLAYREFHRKIAEVMSLQYQFDTNLGARVSSSWICNDIDGRAFLQKLIQEKVDVFRLKEMEKIIEQISKPAIQWYINEMLGETAAIAVIAKMVCRIFPVKKKLFRIVLDWRNEIAVKKIIEELSGGHSVVSFWGAAHLPGIGRLLKRQGFVKISEDWITAYHKRNYCLLKAILSL